MQCPNCQHWNEVGSRFCEECGHELPVSQEVAYQVPVRAASDPPDSASVSPTPAPISSDDEVEEAPVAPYAGPRLVLASTGSIFKLGSATVIGREDPSLQIDFEGYPDGQFVSHRHAQIVKMNDQFYLEDLGSSNHSWVNDIKLAQGQAEPLKDGDVIKLGKIQLTFHEA